MSRKGALGLMTAPNFRQAGRRRFARTSLDRPGWKAFAQEEEKRKRKNVARLHSLAEALNYQLTPKPSTP